MRGVDGGGHATRFVLGLARRRHDAFRDVSDNIMTTV